MAKGTSEREDDFEDDWSDDDFSDDQEQDDGNDEEFNVDKLSTSERKKYDKMRQTIEDSLVEAISNGDTKSGVYKGLQKVLAKRDRELAETRNALAGVMGRVGTVEEKGGDVEFLTGVLKEMLDDDSKKVFEDKFNQFQSSKKANKNEQMLNHLLQQGQQRGGIPQYGNMNPEEDDQITQYKKEATKKLQEFAKKMGADPKGGKLDFGDEDEPLLVRMNKLSASIERVNDEDDEDIEKVRRKTSRPDTRTKRDPGGRDDDDSIVNNILSRGTQSMVSKMRKL